MLYAGSLVNLMERGIKPAFDKADGTAFRGYAGGSNKLANEIKGKLVPGDVFISANPKVNAGLMGAANGAWVDWYVTFAQSPLVIGYNPSSRFAADLKSKPWYEVLQEPGIRIGRTDPKLDPKGKLTLELLEKASAVYKIPDLSKKVLGAPENPAPGAAGGRPRRAAPIGPGRCRLLLFDRDDRPQDPRHRPAA